MNILLNAAADKWQPDESSRPLHEVIGSAGMATAARSCLAVEVAFEARHERDRGLAPIIGRVSVSGGLLSLDSEGPGSASSHLVFERDSDANPSAPVFTLSTKLRNWVELLHGVREITRLSEAIERVTAGEYNATLQPTDWGYTYNTPRTPHAVIGRS